MKKFQKAKYMSMGLAMGLSVAFIPSVWASSGTKTLEALYRDIKLVIDGKAVIPKDGNGNVVEPFIVDGTTYLPVRAISEALGKSVSWNGDTGTITISDKTALNSEVVAVALSELEAYDTRGSKLAVEKIRDMSDKWYDVALTIQPRYSAATYKDYLLDGNYAKIEGTFFAEYGSNAKQVGANIKIWGDGKLLYDAGGLKTGLASIDFSVDLSGVKILTMGWEMPPERWACNSKLCTSATIYKFK